MDAEAPEKWQKDSVHYTTRRKSVVGEKFDPEKDEVHDLKVYPKTDIQRERLRSVLQRIVLFRALDSEQMAKVVDCMYEINVKRGDVIIRKGDEGDNFYVIEKGEFGVTCDDGALPNGKIDNAASTTSSPPPTQPLSAGQFNTVLKDEGYFGELALMYNVPRSATVVALSDGLLWAMERRSFRGVVLHAAYLKRQRYEELISNMPVLHPLGDYDKMRLADALVEKQFPPHEPIFTAGQQADGMYFLVSGTIRVTLGARGTPTEREIRVQGPGTYFGERALLHEGSRTANVIAGNAPVTCAFVDKSCFERLLGPCTDLLEHNMADYKFDS